MEGNGIVTSRLLPPKKMGASYFGMDAIAWKDGTKVHIRVHDKCLVERGYPEGVMDVTEEWDSQPEDIKRALGNEHPSS